MSHITYDKARKMGDKAYKLAIATGKYPYLPVLDDILDKEQVKSDVSLGLVNIPLDRIVGTSSAGRTQAFANNFMPIMGEKTEFGSKWSMLADAHVAEGIHDPIKVYEYLNYYYVVEGNKRVSVLKFYGADSVPAFVTRRVPVLTDDPIIRIYYEFMDFNRDTGVNFIWFSHEGAFKTLTDEVAQSRINQEHIDEISDTDIVGTSSDSADGGTAAVRKTGAAKVWSEDAYLEFKAAYYRFEKIYKQRGGDGLSNITTGDAFLALIHIYSFDVVHVMDESEMSDAVRAIWQEFMMINERYAIEISLDPPDVKNSIMSTILPTYTESKPLKAAFIYDKDPSQSDWLYQHELGRRYVNDVFGGKVQTIKVTTACTEEDAIKAMEDLIAEQGVEMIFTTTSKLIDASLKCAVEHPNVKILNCSLNTSHRYIRTYYARLYEAKFLSGMLAGMLTESDKIGYLADYPIFGIVANINAFARGVSFVNPRAKVYLRWTTKKYEADKDEMIEDLKNFGVDIVSDQDMITPKKASRSYGLYKLTDGEPENIMAPVYNWGVLYERIIKLVLGGKWDSADSEEESKAINYWWGLSAGVVDMIMSRKVPTDLRFHVNILRNMIISGEFSPFRGSITAQDGTEVVSETDELSIGDIIKMNWLMGNVVGEIPATDELEDKAKGIVEIKGVKKDEDTSGS